MKLLYGLAGFLLEILAILIFIMMILHGYFIGEKTSTFTGIVNATVWCPSALAVSAMIYDLADKFKRKANFLGLFGPLK